MLTYIYSLCSLKLCVDFTVCASFILCISATDGDDSEDATISHPQSDPDTAQQGSTNKEHSTPNDHKQQDEVDGSDRWNEENANTG